MYAIANIKSLSLFFVLFFDRPLYLPKHQGQGSVSWVSNNRLMKLQGDLQISF